MRPYTMSSYRPHYAAPPPPPPFQMPPLPPGPPPSYDPYNDSWKPSRGPEFSLPQSDFSFRVQDSAPRYPGGRDSHRNRQSQNNHRPSDRNPLRNRRDAGRGGRPFRGRGPKPMPSDRPLLRQNRGEAGKEQMLGVDSHTQKYIPVSLS